MIIKLSIITQDDNMKNLKQNCSIVQSIFTKLLICLTFLLVIEMCFIVDSIFLIKKDIKDIQIAMDCIEQNNSFFYGDDSYMEHYIVLSEKADAEMERLVSVVGILATVYTIFGALVVFKAPHEIDQRINELNRLTLEANKAAEEAKYQAEIIDSVVNDYNGRMTNYDKLCRISKVIDKYPYKADAYIQRGFIYDSMGQYDEAISDYKVGLKYGGKKAPYFGNMGIAFNKKGELKKALVFYTKAINLEPDDAIFYVNRGSCYDDMKEYVLAIHDYTKAIELDDGCKEAYKNRSLTYRSQMHIEDNEGKKKQLYEKMILDLQKALEIDPEDEHTRNLLRNNLKANINPDEMIAKIDERIGDLELESKNYFVALKQYIESSLYYFRETMQQKYDYTQDIKRLILKIFDISREEIVSELPRITKELTLFCQILHSYAVDLYINGDKSTAEKSFILLSRYDNHVGWAINLAFMKRRNETRITSCSVFELLNICENPNDAFWCINKALAYVSGSDNHEVSWNKAIDIMANLIENIDDAINWWSDIKIVGEAENNMVSILLTMSKQIGFYDNKNINERIGKARDDGYFIPKDI